MTLPTERCGIEHAVLSQQVSKASHCAVNHGKHCYEQPQRENQQEQWHRRPAEHDLGRMWLPSTPPARAPHAAVEMVAVQAKHVTGAEEREASP